MTEMIYCDKSDLVAAADAVREKKNTSDAMEVKELAEQILSISGGGSSGSVETINIEFYVSSLEGIILEYTDANFNFIKRTMSSADWESYPILTVSKNTLLIVNHTNYPDLEWYAGGFRENGVEANSIINTGVGYTIFRIVSDEEDPAFIGTY